jgi:tetratricopeptide (TPR) repeat protein
MIKTLAMNRKIFLCCLFLFSFSIANSQYSEMVFEEGVSEFNKGNYTKADSLFTASINYDGSEKDYLKYYNRGVTRRMMDSISLAIKDLDTALFLNPKFYPAYENKAICQYLWGDHEVADNTIDKGLLYDKHQFEGYILSAIINIRLKNYKKIIDQCNKARGIKEDPRVFMYKSMGYTYLKKNDLALSNIMKGKEFFGEDNDAILEGELFYLFSVGSTRFCTSLLKYQNLGYSLTADFTSDEEFKKKCSECER